MKLFRAACLPLLSVSFCLAADLKPSVTYSRDVAPIFFNHCTRCHHPNDVAPMSLLTYKEAQPWARAVRAAVLGRKMPPWFADPHYGEFANDDRLSEAQIQTIKAWVDSGCPEGDPKDLPPTPRYGEGWRMGTPDAIFPIPQDHAVKAGSDDRYVYFTVPTNFKQDMWIQAVELRPGNRLVVHHAHAFVVNPPDPAAKHEVASKDSVPKPRYTFQSDGLEHTKPDAPIMDDGCSSPDGGRWPGETNSELTTMLSSFLPGKDPDVFPTGYARKIPAGANIQFQIHYHALSDKTELDRTSVGVYFAKEPPKQALRRIDIHNTMFRIPAGDPNHRVTACYTFPQDMELMSYTAHMHLRGKDMQFDIVRPNGTRETIFRVPKYDFNWQTEYQLKRPVPIEKGTRLEIIAHFDNSANNPFNPDPTKVIRWGEPSYEEMMDGWLEFILPEKPLQARADP